MFITIKGNSLSNKLEEAIKYTEDKEFKEVVIASGKSNYIKDKQTWDRFGNIKVKEITEDTVFHEDILNSLSNVCLIVNPDIEIGKQIGIGSDFGLSVSDLSNLSLLELIDLSNDNITVIFITSNGQLKLLEGWEDDSISSVNNILFKVSDKIIEVKTSCEFCGEEHKASIDFITKEGLLKSICKECSFLNHKD